MKHKFFTTLLVMLMSMAGSNALAQDYDVSAENDDGITIYYKLINEGSELEVVKGDGYSASTIQIPTEVHDYVGNKDLPVTSIGDNAFEHDHNLTKIHVPNSVTSIGNYAFNGCLNLGEIDLPYGITRIGDDTFADCSSLTEISIPNGVTSIGNEAFKYCNNLTSVNIPNSVKSIGSYAFHRDNGSPMKLIVEDISSWLEISFSWDIGDYYLYSDENTEINNLVIPSTVTSIGAYCFNRCKNITSVDLPNSLKTIGKMAFCGCVKLSSISLPNSVTSIGDYAFSGCSKLQSVYFSNTLTSIGSYAFENCFELSSIDLPNSLESIGMYAFYRCLKLSYAYIPSNVKEIGFNPFVYCENLQSVSVSTSNGFYDSNDINGIVETSTSKVITAVRNTAIPNRIKIIGNAAFLCMFYQPHAAARAVDCSIILPEGVEEIGDEALATGLHVETLRIPSTLKKIGNSPFSFSYVEALELADIKTWCEAETGHTYNRPADDVIVGLYHDGVEIKELVIPDGTTKIRDYCFMCVKGITSVVIPSSVKSIGWLAFSRCTNLTSVTISRNVTEISENALSGCTSLTSITVEWETPITITSYDSFNRADVTLYVPRGCKAAYEAADYWKDFKEIKEYGDGNATIAMGSSGIATYSNSSDLNFTDVSGLKAYIASGFNPATGNLTMTRVYEVPAGEGLILKGAADSYEVPYEETSAYYANLLVGVPTATTVNPTDGSYTNFILANDAVKGIGFYPLASAGEIGANKAYLQLPTSILPATSRTLRMVFEDEEEKTTGINALNEKGEMINDKAVYDLQGRRVVKPTRGLYIKDGKKIMVK